MCFPLNKFRKPLCNPSLFSVCVFMVWSPHVPSFIGKSERCEGFWLVPLCGYSVMLTLHFTLEFLLSPETLYRCVFQWFWNIFLTQGKGSNLEYEKKIPKVGRIGGGRAELSLWLSWYGHMNLTALKIQLFLWMRTEVPPFFRKSWS